jgi:hypothetical protein
MQTISATNHQVVRFGKKITLTFRILLALVILIMGIAALPWLFPTNDLASTIIPMEEVFTYIKLYHHDLGSFLATLSPLGRICGLVGSELRILPLLLGTLLMTKLAHNYANGKVFNLANAQAYSYLGKVYLINALLLQPISQMLFYLCGSLNNPAGQRVIGVGVELSNISAIFFATILIIIAKVMRLAHSINEEQQLTV